MPTPLHRFHIPVMGTGFTIDTPIKVARFGISSVMSIGDDELCEVMREYYSSQFHRQFEPILKWESDYRSRRITAYLDLVHDIVEQQLHEMKSQDFVPGTDLWKYFELLPTDSPWRVDFKRLATMSDPLERAVIEQRLRDVVVAGSLDVNIMTKIDRLNYSKYGELLPEEFSDALSALRGYANSKLTSCIVFSAGFNRRLYAYVEKFSDFFPDSAGQIKKKIILKVSDYRSSLTQGKFFAKKGIWVSEHRIESGLNCGGHAFATDGYLLGPILEEFKLNKDGLVSHLRDLCNDVLTVKGRPLLPPDQSIKITVQGGIGTSDEQQFLFDRFDVDATGWATPFLLVPEVTSLDAVTRQQLADTTEEDLYLSGISPLGVPFNTYRGSASETLLFERVKSGKPGSPCPKGYLVSNTEFTSKPICTASSVYQKRKLAQIRASEMNTDQKNAAEQRVIAKTCLCEDLAAGAIIDYRIPSKRDLAPAVCPGPNLAYFSRIGTLLDMVGHIYGRNNMLNDTPRPNMFVAEFKMYIAYLERQVTDSLAGIIDRRNDYFADFLSNLRDGVDFYRRLGRDYMERSSEFAESFNYEINRLSDQLSDLANAYPNFFQPAVSQN
ncbi:hypothetical protein EB093_05685 [bacterium]|nr:hypothetical protein [bacterium]